MNWEDKPEVKKGNMAEQIVDDFLRSKGLCAYFPVHNGPHPFDRLCATQDKKSIVIVDSKAKAARTHYPDTGINKRNYDEYVFIQDKYHIPIWIFFVDEYKKAIYGNTLRELSKPILIKHKDAVLEYPLEHKGIIYFPLQNTKTIASLSNKQSEYLKSLSTRQYDYIEPSIAYP